MPIFQKTEWEMQLIDSRTMKPIADSTGQFAGLGGSGTDDLQSAGGQVSGSYIGTLG